ncbi:MAG TPA: FliH/SctL family protein [Novosphingobium sp.]|nr:FliH/SctL family protein [Novosphingobium sp.]
MSESARAETGGNVTRLVDFTQMTGRSGPFSRDARFVALTDMARPEGGPVPFAALGMPRLGPGNHDDEDLPDVLIDALAQPPADPIALARAEGYAQGAADAEAAAAQDAAEANEAIQRLVLSFSRMDAAMTEGLRQKLMDTVIALCESCLAPLALDRQALALRAERAAALFQRADDERVMRLHPLDLELAHNLLPADWAYLPDATLARGAIRVETRNGGIEDGPTQWRQAILEALDLGTGTDA